jgi:hypothetical protein
VGDAGLVSVAMGTLQQKWGPEGMLVLGDRLENHVALRGGVNAKLFAFP